MSAVALFVCASVTTTAYADAKQWNDVVSKYAKRSGFDYAGLAKDAESLTKLNSCIAHIAKMKETAALHAWLNVYNVLVVDSVLKHQPLKSVMDVPGFFKKQKHKVASKMRTLDEIENNIIRPRFNDPRVHVALNCGARSCPRLYEKAFTKQNLNASLNRLAKDTVANTRHVAVKGKSLRVSEIFHWFASDFEKVDGSVLAWLKKYDNRGHLQNIAAGSKLGKLKYNWSLNQARVDGSQKSTSGY